MESPYINNTTRSESPDSSMRAENTDDAGGVEDVWMDEDDDDIDSRSSEHDDSEGLEFFDLLEETEPEYHDAAEGMDDTNNSSHEGDGEYQPQSRDARARSSEDAHVVERRIHVSPAQVMELLGQAGLQRLFTNHMASRLGDSNTDDDGLEGGYGGLRIGFRRRRRPRNREAQYPLVPSDDGKTLMAAGIFGNNEYYEHILKKRKPRLAGRLMSRELGLEGANPTQINRLLSQGLIPSSNADTIIHYDSRCYSGQFSHDGNFFFSCAQDFKVRMYDTSNPYEWKYYKTVDYPYGQWTITDASLSPDNRYLAYTSIRCVVCLASTDPNESSEPVMLDFSDMGQRDGRQRLSPGYRQFSIWSIRFSGDGREIVGGTSDHSVYVHDIEAQKSTLRIPGHSEDVNAVCFGDASSPHILYSGSDDSLIKIWDRRSMGDNREAGVFMGHTEGLTYVDSKGDGRYVLSNGKDQMMKLWDLRKMVPTDKASKLDPSNYITKFDYRFMDYSDSDYTPHPHDCSVVTFRGHRVLKTLIRCHFSPPGSTNSRYVYSGSEDGSVYIYNLDATLAGKINVTQATYQSRPRDPDLYTSTQEGSKWKTCVRDASWHPNAPIIAATSWNGWGMSTGTCTSHSWREELESDNVEPKMSLRVNERLEYDENLFENSRLRNRRTSQFRAWMRNRRTGNVE